MSASRSFFIVAIVLLLWNLMGIVAFVIQYTADLAALAKSDPYTARIFAGMPGWAWAAYAVAVGCGTLGAIMLLMRKGLAAPLFALSVLGVVAQFAYSFFGTDLLAIKGAGAAAFPAAILAVAVGQLLYAGRMRAKGVLQ